MEVLERAYAKLNISLDTPFIHNDGQHEWDMLMVSIDLADTVIIKTTDEHQQIRVESTSGLLPLNEKNLAYQAAMLMREYAQEAAGVEIHIDKRIPVAAGMGGGSSDAAAVLRGLNKIWELGLSNAELAEIGLKVDADVPYCVYSRPALVTGRGEIVTPLETKFPSLWCVVSKPNISVSTPKILKMIDYDNLDHGDMTALMDNVLTGQLSGIYETMFNVLEPITTAKYPEIKTLKDKMVKFGAPVVQMSGTGPTVFALTDKESKAKRIYNGVRGFVQETYVTHIIQ
ncbi:4-(cytidine 5'-diphospho)-2-C-methyl-D-erythritol kinase [Weissella tructae]|uniref:4-diphosphocytidyl-2-C-methyl-D-erythritol kinase n=2 Tax=Weissella TaxID=46255 RepID=A0A075U4F7_9LACO|nr:MULTISPECIES: 4-(cytidine 5'-diphospho)-2-C-methyl-D-erythritol kinase [Weissella]AIG65032.1 4-diphosphocytidyl-2-C-methyl-D-erythritol kinase [Weissella tructae]AIM62344.1 4-diphosphocytidyl-2-C-methyl-D-erythritol kinase [Weissella ceti]AIM63683.1 4-diphosphocytidyl-2-C-methyl-D-erythritol kinase [Weissella ceti]ELA07775.1 4-diphosphocytidyl-2-C-methyl-D-erythritol kinase [Weissella ceti NC36]QVV91436.1 4-(cytidine 5'-diphospho)-2-C-methyl-D-erythritol kinase [Weissella tructae]